MNQQITESIALKKVTNEPVKMLLGLSLPLGDNVNTENKIAITNGIVN